MLTISLDINSNNNNVNDNNSNNNNNNNNSNNNSENISNDASNNDIDNDKLPNSVRSNHEPPEDDGIPNNNDYPQSKDASFIGDIDMPDEISPSDEPTQMSETNTPIISGESFGIVPQTGVPNITAVAITMCTSFIISVLLWLYIVRHKYIWR